MSTADDDLARAARGLGEALLDGMSSEVTAKLQATLARAAQAPEPVGCLAAALVKVIEVTNGWVRAGNDLKAYDAANAVIGAIEEGMYERH